MKKLKWQERDDGVIFCDPTGLVESYYIYPPNYDNDGKTSYILSIIDINGKVISEYTTLSIEEAKNKALEKFELVFNLLQNCLSKEFSDRYWYPIRMTMKLIIKILHL